jgi:hypothetical protein
MENDLHSHPIFRNRNKAMLFLILNGTERHCAWASDFAVTHLVG